MADGRLKTPATLELDRRKSENRIRFKQVFDMHAEARCSQKTNKEKALISLKLAGTKTNEMEILFVYAAEVKDANTIEMQAAESRYGVKCSLKTFQAVCKREK